MNSNGSHEGMNMSNQLPIPNYSHAAVAEYNSLIERLRSFSLDSSESCTHDGRDICPTCSGTGRVSPEVAWNSWHRGQLPPQQTPSRQHQDLVRAVAMDADVVVSASYDSTIKVSCLVSCTCLTFYGGSTNIAFLSTI